MKKELENKIEREYTIPLREKVMKVPGYKRAKKAIRTIREFLVKHMRVRDRDLNKIKVDKFLNQEIWRRGIKNPPHKIKVKVTKEGEIVKVESYELSEKLKFQKQREERMIEKSNKIEKKEPEQKETAPTDELKKEEIEEKKKTTIESEQKFEKRKAVEKKKEMPLEKRPIQRKKEHSK